MALGMVCSFGMQASPVIIPMAIKSATRCRCRLSSKAKSWRQSLKTVSELGAARYESGAFVNTFLNIAADALLLRFGDEWPEFRLARARVADGETFGRRLGNLHGFVIARFRHQQACVRRTGLPGIKVTIADAGGDCPFQVGIIENDARRFAAEFKGDDEPAARSAVVARVASECGVVPADVVFVKPGTLPRTSSGKLRRLEVKRNLEGASR